MVWVTVPKPPIDIRKVQTRIVNRRDVMVDDNESVKNVANKFHQRLEERNDPSYYTRSCLVSYKSGLCRCAPT